MFLANLAEVLEGISEFVNKCLGPLGADGFTFTQIRDFLIQMCSTIILFIVVRRFLWKPITNILETKANVIDQQLAEAQASNETAKSLEMALHEQMSLARVEVKALLDKAERDGITRRDMIVNEAKEEAQKRLSNIKLEIEQEIVKKNKEVRQSIVDIAFAAANKIVAREIDQEKYLDIVNDIIEGATK